MNVFGLRRWGSRVMAVPSLINRAFAWTAASKLEPATHSQGKCSNKSVRPVLMSTALGKSELLPLQRVKFSSEAASLPKEHFDKLVKNNKVVIFMKGVPDEPRCGFSNAVVQVLRMHGVTSYDAHNVLADENIRQGIKEYTNWPTIPQIFINGEFVGGCDILIEMHKNGELIEQLAKVGIKSALSEQEGGNKDDTKK